MTVCLENSENFSLRFLQAFTSGARIGLTQPPWILKIKDTLGPPVLRLTDLNPLQTKISRLRPCNWKYTPASPILQARKTWVNMTSNIINREVSNFRDSIYKTVSDKAWEGLPSENEVGGTGVQTSRLPFTLPSLLLCVFSGLPLLSPFSTKNILLFAMIYSYYFFHFKFLSYHYFNGFFNVHFFLFKFSRVIIESYCTIFFI